MTFSIHFRIYIQSYIFLLWPFFRSIFHSQLELIIIQMIGVVIATKIHIYLAPKEKQWFIAETEFASFLSELLFLFRSCFIFKNHMPCFLAIRFFSRYRIARMYIRYNQTWRVFSGISLFQSLLLLFVAVHSDHFLITKAILLSYTLIVD